MRNILFLLLLLSIPISGCSAQSRLTRLKDRKENTLSVSVKGTIEEAKEMVREAGRELALVEVPSVAAENFMVLRTNMLTALGSNVVYGTMAGPFSSGQTRLGFFFGYDAKKKVTTITIAEEVMSYVSPSRFEIERKIEFINLRRIADKQFER